MPKILGIDISTRAQSLAAMARTAKYKNYMKTRGMYVKQLQDIKKKYNWTDNDLKEKGLWNDAIMKPYLEHLADSRIQSAGGGLAGSGFFAGILRGELPEAGIVTPNMDAAPEAMPAADAIRQIENVQAGAEAVLNSTSITPTSPREFIEREMGNAGIVTGRPNRMTLLEEKGPSRELPAESTAAGPRESIPANPDIPANPLPAPVAAPTTTPATPTTPPTKPARRPTKVQRRNQLLENILGSLPTGTGSHNLKRRVDNILERNPMPSDYDSNSDASKQYNDKIKSILQGSTEFRRYKPSSKPPAAQPVESKEPQQASPSQPVQPPSSGSAYLSGRATPQQIEDTIAKAKSESRMFIDEAVRSPHLSYKRRQEIIDRVMNDIDQSVRDHIKRNNGNISRDELKDIYTKFKKSAREGAQYLFDQEPQSTDDSSSSSSSAPLDPDSKYDSPDQPPSSTRPPDDAYDDVLNPEKGQIPYPTKFYPTRTAEGTVATPANQEARPNDPPQPPNVPQPPPGSQPGGRPIKERPINPQPKPQPPPRDADEPDDKQPPFDDPRPKPDDRPRPDDKPKDPRKKPPDKPDKPDAPNNKGPNAHDDDAVKKQSGYGYLRPFFDDYHGINLLTMTGAQSLEDIKEFDLFDVPIPENETMDNPVFMGHLKNLQFRFSGVASDKEFYRGSAYAQHKKDEAYSAGFKSESQLVNYTTQNTFMEDNLLERGGADAVNLWYNPYDISGRYLTSEAFRTESDESDTMTSQIAIHPELLQAAQYTPDAPMRMSINPLASMRSPWQTETAF